MKQANNNEVDLLLRALASGRDGARSQSSSDFGDGPEVFADHLDADELNSYAEGVVPAPARARYVAHLADCDACRGIVIGLTQAAGVAGRTEVREQERGSNFWQTLAALFSPAVLRFAVPALVVTAVIGIGLLVLRQPRPGEFMAKSSEQSSTPPAAENLRPASAANPSQETPLSALPNNSPTTAKTGEPGNEKSDLQAKKLEEDAPLPVSEAPVAKAPLKDTKPGEVGGILTTQPYALEPKAGAAAPPPATREDAKSDLAKEQSEKRAEQERSRDELLRNQPDDGQHGPNRARSSNNTASPAANQRNAGIIAGRGPSGMDKNKANVVETRSISGRRFVRDDGVWIDTDYDAPRATIRVTRGSDQFRALIADEPGLRTIADQLSGAVIVVWKNRAYRIQ